MTQLSCHLKDHSLSCYPALGQPWCENILQFIPPYLLTQFLRTYFVQCSDLQLPFHLTRAVNAFQGLLTIIGPLNIRLSSFPEQQSSLTGGKVL